MIREGSGAIDASAANASTPVVNQADRQPLETKSNITTSSSTPKSTPTTTSLSTPASTGLTGRKRKSCGHPGCDFRTSSLVAMTDHRKSLGHSMVSPKKSRKLLQSPASPSRATLLCGYKECDFTSKYLSNLSRHRRRRNHFITEEVRKKPKICRTRSN